MSLQGLFCRWARFFENPSTQITPNPFSSGGQLLHLPNQNPNYYGVSPCILPLHNLYSSHGYMLFYETCRMDCLLVWFFKKHIEDMVMYESNRMFFTPDWKKFLWFVVISSDNKYLRLLRSYPVRGYPVRVRIRPFFSFSPCCRELIVLYSFLFYGQTVKILGVVHC